MNSSPNKSPKKLAPYFLFCICTGEQASHQKERIALNQTYSASCS
jgi:hypothetical protein